MSEINFSSGNKIAEAIDKRIIAIAKQVANKSTVNRTVFGRVTAKNNGLFSLRINNTVYTNVIALKNSNYINVGDKVVCLVPNNQFNDLLILGVADGSLLATSEYTLNQASSTELGGIKANNRTVEDQEVRIDPNTGFLYYSLGKSIESIEKTSTSGLVDTYTITYTDGTYTTFTVTNADQIDIQYVNGQLQWKYASETAWTTLFSVDGVLSTTSVNPIQNKVVTNAINNISNNINNNVVENISTSVTGDNFSLIQTLINLNTQATTQQSVNLPLANASAAGLMSSSDFSSLQDLEDRVGNLEGKTTRLLYTASTNPTASDINSFVTGLGYTSPFEGIAVVVDETFHIWHYYDNNGIGWRDDGVDTVSNFTNSTAGIILGSTNNGKVFAETDGTGSVNGWDTLSTNVSNLQSTTQALSSSVSTLQNTVSTHTSNISDLQTTTQNLSNTVNSLNTQVGTNTSNITNLQNNKIDINQGSSNTGKVLTVGSDGNVVPQDIPSSGGTIVNIANVPQGTVNFTSDPQTQINLLNNSVTAIELTGSNGTLTATQSNILANYPNAFIILNGTIKLYRHYCTINGILIDRAIYCSMINDVGSLSIININNLQWSVSTDTVLLNEISQTITGTKNFNTITANNLTINNRVEGEGSATSYSGKPITVTSYSVKYRIAPDGFKTVYGYVRWNRTSSTDSEGVVINFGTTFESTEYAVSVTVIDTSTNQYHSVGTYILDGQQTTSSVVVLVQNINNSSRHAGISFIIQGV